MTNYKKGILSLATALALASSAMASSYVPLTSTENDDRWVLYGVNGLKKNGATSETAASFTNWGIVGDTHVTDNVVDEVSVSGLLATTTVTTTSMGEIKALNLPSGALSEITINFNSLVETFSQTEPTRTMYFKAQGNEYADAMFTYKASLEGKTLEFQINGSASKTYSVVISALNTFDNPATRAEKEASSGEGGIELNTVSLAMDFDLLDNPQDPADYNRVANSDNPATHQTQNSNASTRMYKYNSVTSSWEIYDSANSELANDFTDIKEGKAYWAKVDLDGNDLSEEHTRAGLVLGKTGLQDSDYDGELAVGWNLISFDAKEAEIRTSNTGMIFTNSVAGGAVDIVDSTGVNTVTVTLPGVTTQADAIAINLAIESAKAKGVFADIFDLRAFRVSATEMLLISNKKFSLKDTAGVISGARTMAGQPLWDIANDAVYANSAADIDAVNGASTVFGESGLIFKVLVGANTAAELDEDIANGTGAARSAAIYVNAQTNSNGKPILTYLTANDTTSTVGGLAAAAALIKLDADIEESVTVDLDNDGTEDYVLAAATEPFFIRDHTFTRVMTYDNTGAGNTFKIASPIPANITTDALIATTVTNVNAVADDNVDAATTDTTVYAHNNGGDNNIVFISAGASVNNFNLFDDVTNDYLLDTTSTEDIAKGAVKDVFSINYLAKQKIYPHTFSSLVVGDVGGTPTMMDNLADKLQVNLNGAGLRVDIAPDPLASTAALRKDMFDTIVADVRAAIITAKIDATATHDFIEADDNWKTAKITVTGYGVTGLVVEVTDGGGVAEDATNTGVDANVATAGKLDTPIANLTADLKYNAVYTPDFAKDGPLYTLKDLKYTAQAMVTGSTNMSAGTVAWDNIDLTRLPSEWFRNSDGTIHNDYNLFSIDGKAGYWTYLIDSPDTNDLTITDVTVRPTYVHHFNNNLTTINHVAATIQITVNGLPTDTSSVSVYANVGGSNIELSSTSDDGIYAASLTSYEVQELVSGGNRDITVSVANGLGYRLDSIKVGEIDYKKPNTPVIIRGNGTDIAISSDSSDTTGFYVYEDAIPEENTAASTNKVAKILAAEAGSYNLCAKAASFGIEYNYRAIAMDGAVETTGAGSDGEFGFGNASDATDFTFTATLKGASLLVNTQGVDAKASEIATSYDDSCVPGAADTEDAGISVKSIISDKRVKLSYEKDESVNFSTDTPLTIYVGISTTGLAEIKYVPAYANKAFYIEFNGVVYRGVLPTDDNSNGTSSSALDVKAGLVTGQTL